MKNLKNIIVIIATVIFITSCKQNQPSEEQKTNQVEISYNQFKIDSMAFGTIETRIFENIIKCNGIIAPLPNGIANIGVPYAGIIKKINCTEGQFVNEGQILLEVTGNEIIDIQKDLAETAASLKRLKSEYERVKALYEDKVGTEKEFVTAESEFAIAKAKYNGLKLKINTIGLSTAKIENGEFYQSYQIKSPIKGYISKLNVKLGSHIDNESTLLEIIDPTTFQAKLSVFPNDVPYIKKGQLTRIKLTNNNDTYSAILSSIGNTINDSSKTIDCFANINDKNFNLTINNIFIEAEIITKTDSAKALPIEAIIKSGNKHYILTLAKESDNKYFFNKIEVKIGRQNSKYVEILNYNSNDKIIVKGTYNIIL